MNLRARRRRLLLKATCAYLGAGLPARWLAAADQVSNVENDMTGFLKIMLQILFPHDRLDEAAYEDVARAMSAAVLADPDLHALVRVGRRQLDDESSKPWEALAPLDQIHGLAQVEGSAFFQTIRGLGNFLFYNNPDLWPFFGYEGSSYEKGGYINRGFDDLDWLPDPEP